MSGANIIAGQPNFFKDLLHYVLLAVSVSQVSNDVDKYLLRHSIFNDCLEPDVHHMRSQIVHTCKVFLEMNLKYISLDDLLAYIFIQIKR